MEMTQEAFDVLQVTLGLIVAFCGVGLGAGIIAAIIREGVQE